MAIPFFEKFISMKLYEIEKYVIVFATLIRITEKYNCILTIFFDYFRLVDHKTEILIDWLPKILMYVSFLNY